MSNAALNAGISWGDSGGKWTLEEAAQWAGSAVQVLAPVLVILRNDVQVELALRRSPRGLQAGTPKWSQVPVSTLIAIERTCQRALDAAGVVGTGDYRSER